MLRRAACLLYAGLLAGQPALAAEPSADAREIVRTVLVMEARGLEPAEPGYRPLCVAREIRAPRTRMPRHSGRPPIPPHFWFGDVSADDGSIQAGPQVSPELANRLFAAEAMAWAQAGAPPLLTQIQPEWMASPLVFCAENRMGLQLSAPVLVGDLAFLAVDYQCALCGQGMLLVLERRTSGWAVIATADQWVS